MKKLNNMSLLKLHLLLIEKSGKNHHLQQSILPIFSIQQIIMLKFIKSSRDKIKNLIFIKNLKVYK